MKRLGILLSGRGSNFLAIHQAILAGQLLDTEIAVVLSNKSDAPGLAKARELGLPTFHIPASTSAEREVYTIALLREHRVDLVCLAGYMRIISPAFVAAYRGRIVNVHPSLLPSFPGLDAQRQALDFGAKIAGCTVHFVDEHIDHGEIILQRAVEVSDDDSAETLAARILIEEHKAFPEAIARVLSGDYQLHGRRFLKR